MVKKGEMMDVDDIVDLLSIDLVGVVPDDEYIITQTNKGEPSVTNSKSLSGKAYMETARRIRVTEGKHVIPVPTFEIKKDFSGYLLDPLQIFKSKGKGQKPYVSEKSIIRPTFSYLGNYTISDNVLRTIITYISKDVAGIHKIQKIKIENYPDGMVAYIEVILEYGHNLPEIMKELKEKAKKEIDRLTAMNVLDIQITAKGLHIPGESDD